MRTFSINRHDRFQEINVQGDVSPSLMREVLREISRVDGFLSLGAMWVFSAETRPPAFHEFEEIIDTVEKAYPQRPDGKRVALVVPSSFARSVADVFRAAAHRLPVTFEIFTDRDRAVRWLES